MARLLLGLAVVAGMAVLWRRAEERGGAPRVRSGSARGWRQARRHEYAGRSSRPRLRWALGDAARARQTLERGEPDRRGSGVAHLNDMDRSELLATATPDFPWSAA